MHGENFFSDSLLDQNSFLMVRHTLRICVARIKSEAYIGLPRTYNLVVGLFEGIRLSCAQTYSIIESSFAKEHIRTLRNAVP